MQKQRAYFMGKRPRIEIIPMIDIMMFLLVFFIMITLKMIASATLKIDLPAAATADALPDTRILIGVQNDGLAAVEGVKMSRADILTVLKRAQTQNRKVDVVLALDKDVSAELLVDAMKVAQEAGISSVGITARSATP
mgnify:FL=1